MRAPQFFAMALALGLVAGAAIHPAAAQEPQTRAATALPERLATQSELDAVRLNLVDEKIALSLAVETQIQIELIEFALPAMRHDDLKRFAEKKRGLYRRLLSTLEELTGGETGRSLARATRKPPGSTAAAEAPPAIAGSAAGTARPARKRGIGDILQNATSQAVLRVRLDIADEYVHLLRVELETTPPAEFDRHYLDVEMHNQMQVVAMLRIFEKQASPPFSQIIHSATIAAESYAAEARQVAEQLQSVPQAPPVGASPVVETAATAGS